VAVFLDDALAREDAIARRVAEFNALPPVKDDSDDGRCMDARCTRDHRQPSDENPVPKMRLISWGR
jgi:hypothetical protein